MSSAADALYTPICFPAEQFAEKFKAINQSGIAYSFPIVRSDAMMQQS